MGDQHELTGTELGQPVIRDGLGRFLPGSRANPSGRPARQPERVILDLKYGEGGQRLHDQIEAMLTSADTPSGLKAQLLLALLERQNGKPTQQVDVDVSVDVVALIAEGRMRVARERGQAELVDVEDLRYRES